MKEIDQIIAKGVCREQCAVYGEPPCWKVADTWPNTSCTEPGCLALTTAAIETLARSIILGAFIKATETAVKSRSQYDLGYADALEELFEKLTDKSPADCSVGV